MQHTNNRAKHALLIKWLIDAICSVNLSYFEVVITSIGLYTVAISTEIISTVINFCITLSKIVSTVYTMMHLTQCMHFGSNLAGILLQDEQFSCTSQFHSFHHQTTALCGCLGTLPHHQKVQQGIVAQLHDY